MWHRIFLHTIMLYMNSLSNSRKLFLLSLSIICLCSAKADAVTHIPNSVVVITSNEFSISNESQWISLIAKRGGRFELHNLDDVKALEKKISQGLSAVESEAQTVMRKRISEVGEQAFLGRFLVAYRGASLAIAKKIRRYPVIVFDDRFALYGVVNMDEAVKKYDGYIRKENEK